MTTANLGLTKPTVGGDADAWGGEINTDLDLIDAAFTLQRYTNFTNTSTFATTSSTAVMGGFGSAWALTPGKASNVRVKVSGWVQCTNAAGASPFQLRYGTGTAPTQAAAVTGTGATTDEFDASPLVAFAIVPFAFEVLLTGLTPATAYWFDLAMRAASGVGTATIKPISVIIEETF